jgi:hypothetical protein
MSIASNVLVARALAGEAHDRGACPATGWQQQGIEGA